MFKYVGGVEETFEFFVEFVKFVNEVFRVFVFMCGDLF